MTFFMAPILPKLIADNYLVGWMVEICCSGHWQ